jgi:hypothetical protein
MQKVRIKFLIIRINYWRTFFAQTEALAFGKTEEEVEEELKFRKI